MSTTVLDIPICPVKDCGRFRQLYSTKTMTSGKNSYLKTCCKHNYKDTKEKNDY